MTNRAIQARLDDVVGPDGWYNEYKPWHRSGQKEAQICGISIYFPEKGFITKWDGAEDSDIEPVKGGLSDSMKRAAVQWGIGRVLYGMDVVWVDIEKQGKSWIIPKNQRTVLDKAYLDYLDKLKLTPTPAGGVQSTLTPKRAGEAPETGQGRSVDWCEAGASEAGHRGVLHPAGLPHCGVPGSGGVKGGRNEKD